ncbi:unnamed protein product [Psylliodes chrysocephalus]|uniref:Regulatory protein zeste n=1 Tax=Psylliodes chrysocephalus TaxID=3402493 RepID=A0A9P0GLT3_9CUCU|nr:unnamed protein product [Psylliodes chrysocephala]
MSTSQKVQFPNFTVTERARLMNIIANKHASIIEERASSVLKEKAWQAIENEFSASSINVCRTEERKETILMGFLKKKIKEESDEVLLSILNKNTLMGIHIPYDDDADESVIENQKTNELILEYVNAVDVLENKPSTSQTGAGTENCFQSMDSDAVTEPWKKYTSVQL